MLPEPPTDVCALYKVHVVPVVAAWPHQDTQEVQIITQVFNERGPHTAERRGDVAENQRALFTFRNTNDENTQVKMSYSDDRFSLG